MNKKLYLPLIIFLALVIAFVVQLQRNAAGDDPKNLESALIGKPVPEKTMQGLLEDKQYTSEIFRQGKPVLINVWATWCPTCYAEHQYLNELAKQGINMIGVDYKDQTDKAIKWLKDLNNPYKLVIKDEKGSLALDLGVYGAPETFIVDGQGIIHYRHTGDVTDKIWKETLAPIYNKLLEGTK
ncbi:DsbE family thiol:disulfide interchange protein [Pasteurella bettyae]|uniref:Thiol:disulfide interchange protein DsbE n=1 Tax=Pasteurella bettyae CCUG 2042 TaxID=1095749 RepID=I3DH86_9PAST|nr:DsbE family thiol:disulfide interchange protein [Pasteurella bettyae]EIJ71079.1 thiol:disulfide interchange protein DsbE [Pasteurella bettyae CCUG 2042]SUB22245.1 cytochrome c-type biogenesis/thiol:disulfide interchange protein CcmG [Pasteurella bettyae]